MKKTHGQLEYLPIGKMLAMYIDPDQPATETTPDKTPMTVVSKFSKKPSKQSKRQDSVVMATIESNAGKSTERAAIHNQESDSDQTAV